MDELIVNCYSGHTYAEMPCSFEWQGVGYEVVKIEREWQVPGEKCFQVCTMDNKLFRLCYNGVEDQWSLTELVRVENEKRDS